MKKIIKHACCTDVIIVLEKQAFWLILKLSWHRSWKQKKVYSLNNGCIRIILLSLLKRKLVPISLFFFFIAKTDQLSKHHFIAQSQAAFLSQAKETLKPDICIISGDFSENYSFIIQDAVQEFHWTNSMATLHPFVAYYMIQNKLEAISICGISDHLKHDTMTVYAFQKVVLLFIIQSVQLLKRSGIFRME